MPESHQDLEGPERTEADASAVEKQAPKKSKKLRFAHKRIRQWQLVSSLLALTAAGLITLSRFQSENEHNQQEHDMLSDEIARLTEENEHLRRAGMALQSMHLELTDMERIFGRIAGGDEPDREGAESVKRSLEMFYASMLWINDPSVKIQANGDSAKKQLWIAGFENKILSLGTLQSVAKEEQFSRLLQGLLHRAHALLEKTNAYIASHGEEAEDSSPKQNESPMPVSPEPHRPWTHSL